jgi:hypothetical protein
MTLILNGTNGLSDVDGSAATPAIRGTDANTGIFFPAADTIAFSEGGAEVARFDSSGNLGIGTSSMSGRLNVKAVDDTASGGVRLWGYNDGAGNGDRTVYISSISGSGNYNANINYSAWNHLFSIGGVEKARIDSSGNLLVGGTAPLGGIQGVSSYTNFVVGISSQYWKMTNSSATFYFGYNGVDKATINGSTGAYTAVSDVNKKKDFEASEIGLDAVMQLQPKMFRMLDDADDAPKHLGFIAQEVQPLIPQAYSEQDGPDGQKFIGLQDRPIIAALTKAIQELKALVDTQASTITALQADVAALKAQP